MPTAQTLLRNSTGYFNRDDLGNSTLTVTIKDIVEEEVGRDKDLEQVIKFKETPRKLVLNKSRLKQLAGAFGAAELIGEKIELYVDKVEGVSMPIICLRAAGVADD